jgi:hypothetical protein
MEEGRGRSATYEFDDQLEPRFFCYGSSTKFQSKYRRWEKRLKATISIKKSSLLALHGEIKPSMIHNVLDDARRVEKTLDL